MTNPLDIDWDNLDTDIPANLVYVVRDISTKDIVGIFVAGGVHELFWLVDMETDPCQCEAKILPINRGGGIFLTSSDELQRKFALGLNADIVDGVDDEKIEDVYDSITDGLRVEAITEGWDMACKDDRWHPIAATNADLERMYQTTRNAG